MKIKYNANLSDPKISISMTILPDFKDGSFFSFLSQLRQEYRKKEAELVLVLAPSDARKSNAYNRNYIEDLKEAVIKVGIPTTIIFSRTGLRAY